MTTPAREQDWMCERLMALCALDSTTGQEDAVLPALRPILEEAGARLVEQPVEPGRTNVLALFDHAPEILFSTHLDTVPPFIPPRREDGAVIGRGTCDAKGQIVAQLAAIARLQARGHRRLAWLGVVDEEKSSLGAIRAQELRDRLPGLRAVINGEPTQNRLATGQRGILTLRLRCYGEAAHSGTPEKGRSAAWPLLDWLQALRALPRPEDRDLGPEIWNLGLISGGKAPNVVPPHAEATILCRTIPGSNFLSDAMMLKPNRADVEIVAKTDPARFPVPSGFDASPVPFGSDAPRLAALARDHAVVLVGPGSIEVAHTYSEQIALDDLAAGVDLLERLGRHFLETAP